MTTTVDAVYEAGSVRLLTPVTPPDGTHLKVTWTSDSPGGDENLLAKKKSLYEIAMEIAAMPNEGQADGFSGTDHDRILYGENGAR